VPYLLRSLNNIFNQELLEQGTFDIISPYGYPGILLSKSAQNSQFVNLAITKLLQVWQERNVCSAFLRLHPILNEGL
jgi:hypothetical protein